MLHHCIKSDSLLGFVVRVHDRFRDECIKMGLISTKIFAGGISWNRAYGFPVFSINQRGVNISDENATFDQEDQGFMYPSFPQRCNLVRHNLPASSCTSELDADGLLPSEVVADCAVGERLKRSSLPRNPLSFFRSCRVNRAPVRDTSGRIARLAILSFPAYRIDVFSAAKQASKKRNLLLRRRRRGDAAVGYGNNRNCSGTWSFRYRILNAEHRSETGIYCAESVAFLLCPFQMLCNGVLVRHIYAWITHN